MKEWKSIVRLCKQLLPAHNYWYLGFNRDVKDFRVQLDLVLVYVYTQKKPKVSLSLLLWIFWKRISLHYHFGNGNKREASAEYLPFAFKLPFRRFVRPKSVSESTWSYWCCCAPTEVFNVLLSRWRLRTFNSSQTNKNRIEFVYSTISMLMCRYSIDKFTLAKSMYIFERHRTGED